MDIDDIQLGGKHHGAVSIRALGTTTQEDALAYAHIGRKVLGEYKQRLQQSDTLSGHHDVTLQDGTSIRVVTNMQGLSPIDQIYVDTGNRKQKKSRFMVLGYIVHGYHPNKTTSVVNFAVTTPSGKTLGFNSNYGDGLSWGGDPNDGSIYDLQGYPDHGARWIDYKEFLYFDDDLNMSIYADTDYQAVLARISGLQDYWDGHPLTYIPTITGYNSLPGLTASYIYVTSYTYDSGTCDPAFTPPLTWSVETDPVIHTEYVYTYDTGSPVQGAARSTYNYSEPHYVGGWHPEYFPGSIDACYKDDTGSFYSDPINGPAEKGGYNEQHVSEMAAENATLNAIASYAYAITKSVYQPHDSRNYTKVSDAYLIERRKDSHGFYTNTGFYFDEGRIVWTAPNAGHGAGALFMMPDAGDFYRYSYSAALTATNTYDNTAPTGTTAQDGFGTSNAPGYTIIDPPGDQNLTKYRRTTSSMTEAFGIPCKCEAGTHYIKFVPNSVAMSFKVYLLIDGLGLVSRQFSDVLFNPRKKLKIEVKAFDKRDEWEQCIAWALE